MEPVKIQVPGEDFLKQASQTCPYAKENKVENRKERARVIGRTQGGQKGGLGRRGTDLACIAANEGCHLLSTLCTTLTEAPDKHGRM